MIGSLCSSGLRAAIVIPERRPGIRGWGASHLVLGEDMAAWIEQLEQVNVCCRRSRAVGSAHAVARISASYTLLLA